MSNKESICIFCKTNEGTMIHARRKSGAVYKCRDCQRLRVSSQKIMKELNISSHKSTKIEPTDWEALSKENVATISARPFYSR